jgi:hypothetical protein
MNKHDYFHVKRETNKVDRDKHMHCVRSERTQCIRARYRYNSRSVQTVTAKRMRAA